MFHVSSFFCVVKFILAASYSSFVFLIEEISSVFNETDAPSEELQVQGSFSIRGSLITWPVAVSPDDSFSDGRNSFQTDSIFL